MGEVEDILAHYGVKGMKWGVRRDRGHEGERTRAHKIVRADKKFEKRASKDRTFRKLHNEAVKEAHREIASINKKPEYRAAAKSGEMRFDTPTRRRYYNEIDNAYLKSLQRVSNSFGTNASGTRALTVVRDPDRPYGFGVQSVDLTHADEDVFVEYIRDDDGLVVGFKLPEPTGVSETEAILEHYGVKGMKWGVRRSRKERRQAATFGGRTERTPHPDFVRSRKSKAKKPFELSDQELKQLNNRLNQEQRLRQLNPSKIDRGHAVAKSFLAMAGTAGTIYGLAQTPHGKAAISLGSKLASPHPTKGRMSRTFVENLDRI